MALSRAAKGAAPLTTEFAGEVFDHDRRGLRDDVVAES